MKGREELIKMPENYLIRVPIIFIIPAHHSHGPPFLRALLSHLFEFISADETPTILIEEFNSSDWGKFKYRDYPSSCPPVSKCGVMFSLFKRMIRCIGGENYISIQLVWSQIQCLS